MYTKHTTVIQKFSSKTQNNPKFKLNVKIQNCEIWEIYAAYSISDMMGQHNLTQFFKISLDIFKYFNSIKKPDSYVTSYWISRKQKEKAAITEN